MRPESATLRDALLVILRAGGVPMSTDQLTVGLPWKRDVFQSRCASGCVGFKDSADFRTIACQPSGHVVEYRRHAGQIYPHLRALERQGLVRRVRLAGCRVVHWQATWRAPAVQVLELEAMWSA